MPVMGITTQPYTMRNPGDYASIITNRLDFPPHLIHANVAISSIMAYDDDVRALACISRVRYLDAAGNVQTVMLPAFWDINAQLNFVQDRCISIEWVNVISNGQATVTLTVFHY
jgi:hypothetical protein